MLGRLLPEGSPAPPGVFGPEYDRHKSHQEQQPPQPELPRGASSGRRCAGRPRAGTPHPTLPHKGGGDYKRAPFGGAGGRDHGCVPPLGEHDEGILCPPPLEEEAGAFSPHFGTSGVVIFVFLERVVVFVLLRIMRVWVEWVAGGEEEIAEAHGGALAAQGAALAPGE